ncbi:MAG TPA: hypothetical protein VI455_04170 [Terriglobia bacterium]
MPPSATDKILLERIECNFTYHAPQGDQAERYQKMREHARSFALDIVTMCPDSRERSVALTKIEESVMWANAAIARNEAGAHG